MGWTAVVALRDRMGVLARARGGPALTVAGGCGGGDSTWRPSRQAACWRRRKERLPEEENYDKFGYFD